MNYWKILIIFKLIFVLGCNSSFNRDKFYYPGEFRPEFNIGSQSTFSMPSTLTASQEFNSSVITFDTKNNKINVGGAKIALSVEEGPDYISFNSTIDNKDGTYQITYIPKKTGTVKVCLFANNKKIDNCKFIEILPGDLDLNQSDLFISRTNFLIGETADVVLTLRDSNRNIIKNPSLSLYPSIIGTSQGYLSSFSYVNDKWTSIFTATQTGSQSELNVSLLNVGIIRSLFYINVLTTKPNYSNSTIKISSPKLKEEDITSGEIVIKDSTNTAIELGTIDLLPISFETYNGTSLVEFLEIEKKDTLYSFKIKGIKSGSSIKIKAKIDGEPILEANFPTIQVIP